MNGGDIIPMLTHLNIKLQLYVVSSVKERYSRICNREGLTWPEKSKKSFFSEKVELRSKKPGYC